MNTVRTSCQDAVKIVLDTLSRAKSPYSISNLSKQTGLNRRTVKKTLDILMETQENLKEKNLEITKIGQTTVITLNERGGLLNLPEELQNLILKTAYYPTPSREEEILVYLYLQGSLSAEKAVELNKSLLVEKLVKQGQLVETKKDDKLTYYLSEEGQIISRGSLKLYPELEYITALKY
ncbi:MAG: hypothetical protein IAX21_01470 [Candidatus Bathyarchaeota archaeon]|nr:MAG: hypothetical protein NUK63_04325 [Candidatus Bathyarchaeum tardum]WNZ29568.1 MAG: hypothetical protein IAX21_01470 [Candidatus Bathyarchaeota archaeon]